MELVDTNVVSELMRPRPNRGVLAWSGRNRPFAFSVVSLEEVWFGLSLRPSARMERQVSFLLETFAEVLPITDDIARRCAVLRAAQARSGHVRSQADMLIAATARVAGVPLATRNTADFAGCGITLINPFAP